MTEDPLARILRAYRDESTGKALDARALERRIVTTLEARRAPARRYRQWAFAIAAVLAGPAVFAAAGQHLAGWMGPGQWFARTRALDSTSLLPRPNAPVVPLPNAAAAPAPVPTPEPKEITERAAEPRSISLSPPASRPKRTARTAPRRSEVSPPDELELFRAAQRLQSANGEPARILAAWERYLTRFPNGVLALEARFNRARTLARLGRNAAAAQELGHFANGSLGSYRRSQASTLVHVLTPESK